MSGAKPSPPNPGGPIRWASSVAHSDRPAQLNRVCDRCILKKIKCDLTQPSCLNCSDAGEPCTYSHVRKRPGPTKGSRRTVKVSRKLQQTPEDDHTTARQITDKATPNFTPPGADQPSTSPDQTQPITPHLSFDATETLALYCSVLFPSQVFELGQRFDCTINAVFPLFRQGTLLEQVENGAIVDPLPSVIYALSTKAMETDFWCGNVDVHAALSSLADSTTVDVDSVVEPLALNQWRTACLLAWYCFHQTPGKAEAIRIAVLTQKAYQCGLHQIDSVQNRVSFGWDKMSEPMLEDWRHIWWCVYILDCYASFSTATPHQVETQSIRTALVGSTPQLDPNQNLTPQKLFLPPDAAGLWTLVQDISRSEGDKASSLHLVVSILLKEVVTTHRLYGQNPCTSLGERMSALEDHLSAVQLALPTNYMRQTRDILHGESDAHFHWRLLTLLKVHSARLIIRLPCHSLNPSEWDARWQENLEVCYRMVEVIQQWDSPCPPSIDPAVCFICLSLLMLLHLHGLSSGVSRPQLREQVVRRKNIVRLFLHNYARHWTLPQFLLDCYDALVHKIVEPLQPEDIKQVTDQFNGPLHQKWLTFLSLVPPKFAMIGPSKLSVSTNSPSVVVAGTGEACPPTHNLEFGNNYELGNIFEFGNVFEFGNAFEIGDSVQSWDSGSFNEPP
ncbi:hypothetical protein BGZ61DRAFT_589546 [Ilyonectria robusta]|uniref:uncharacterized protein n=1 Tax=Ilyonectria robusta TaxID=1079257 RepID=UPI001E8E1E54|nr:uncharacterized protein BGZ61DRAFT_589546 [Ilyonectria robusta]KAH8686340.1 hypothetical protein BGZ61DRAFT_589546 [Ilyonectria robusta]